jgi:hypothetical protein
MASLTPSALTNNYAQNGINTNEMFPMVCDRSMEWVRERIIETPIEGMKYWESMSTDNDYIRTGNIESGALVPQAKGTGMFPRMHLTPGFSNYAQPQEYALSIVFDKKLIETDQFGVIKAGSTGLAQAVKDTIEYWSVMPYNTCFAATVPLLCADGMRLVDSGRPQEKASAGTWSNLEIPSTLSMNSIATMRNNFEKVRSGTGLIRPLRFGKLVIPQDLEDLTIQSTGFGVKWELGSSKDPSNNTNRLNALTKYGINYEVWHFLTNSGSSSPWFGMALDDARCEAFWLWGMKPDIGPGYTLSSRELKYDLYFRFVQFVNKPLGIRGNAGA